MVALVVLGIALMLAGLALVIAKNFVIKHVTSKPLGTLAPGFAATNTGYMLYAGLVGDFGLVVFAFGVGTVFLVVASIALFVFGSVLVIVGEVKTYRALQH